MIPFLCYCRYYKAPGVYFNRCFLNPLLFQVNGLSSRSAPKTLAQYPHFILFSCYHNLILSFCFMWDLRQGFDGQPCSHNSICHCTWQYGFPYLPFLHLSLSPLFSPTSGFWPSSLWIGRCALKPWLSYSLKAPQCCLVEREPFRGISSILHVTVCQL